MTLVPSQHDSRAPPPPGQVPWWAWVPLALLVSMVAAFWMADLRSAYDPPWLLFTGNFLFATLASAFVFQLVCRSFLAQGTPSLLMLACGVVLWGLAGVLAVGFAGTSDNAMLTIHNVCAWFSAGCHLLSVVWWEPRRRLRPEGWWLLGGALAAVGFNEYMVKPVDLDTLRAWLQNGHRP